MVRQLVRNTGGNDDDAEDIFQDGLMIMLEKIDNKNFVFTCKLKTYLYCICEHLWKDVLDKRSAAANYFSRRDHAEGEEDLSEEMDNQLKEEIFKEVFETLEPLSKKILNMYWQDLGPQEIADKLGYTYNYVRKKKSEAQTELCEKVKVHPGYRRLMNTEMAAREVVH